jgi:hypothetical protein
MEVSGQLHPKGKSLWYSLDRRLEWPQSRSGRGGEEKNSQLLPRLESPIIQPVAQKQFFHCIIIFIYQWGRIRAAICNCSQQLLLSSWKGHYRFCKSTPLYSILRQLNYINILKLCSFKVHFNIILRSTSKFPFSFVDWHFVRFSHLQHADYMSPPINHSLSDLEISSISNMIMVMMLWVNTAKSILIMTCHLGKKTLILVVDMVS